MDARKPVHPVWNLLSSPSMTDSTQIAKSVLQARLDIIEALFSGPEGQELVRLDAAYKALTGQEPPSLSDVLAGNNGSARFPTGTVSLTVTDIHRRGPKEACRDLMLNGPMRTWAYDALEAHFRMEGIIIDAQNPRDAMRTAMAALEREGIVKKVGRGRFRPVRDHSTGATPLKGENTPVGERNREGSY
ncbi:MAG: hypothetical protein WD473_02215 [Acidimicrobiia bacterium]